jgi:hypothetical protein
MKLKIISSIFTAIAIMNCMGTDTPVASESDDTLPSKTADSPQYKEGKFIMVAAARRAVFQTE